MLLKLLDTLIKIIDFMGSGTRDLSACSIAHQPSSLMLVLKFNAPEKIKEIDTREI